MTMLDILKERLPEGLTIAKVKDKSNASQIQIWFDYEEVKGVVSWLTKTSAPGCAEACLRRHYQCLQWPVLA